MTRRDDDDAHDAHLLAALRHAPDRDALPPRDVSERILAAARAAVRPTTPAAPARWWQRVGAWLMRPQVAAAFGTLAVASLVGVMWSTREPPLAEPDAAADRTEQAARTEPAAAVPLPDTAKPDADAATAPPSPAPIDRPKPAPVAKAAKARPELRERDSVHAEKQALPAAQAPAAPPAAAAPEAQAADAAVPAAAAERRTSTTNKSSRRDALGATAAAPTAAQMSARAASDPLARWDTALDAGPSDNVRWRVGDRLDARPIAHGATQAQWWAALRRATAGMWEQQTRVRLPPQPWLSFEISARPAASIHLIGDAVLVCAAERGGCWRAHITPAQHDAWIADVARW